MTVGSSYLSPWLCVILAVARRALLLFSLTVPVTRNPLGLCVFFFPPTRARKTWKPRAFCCFAACVLFFLGGLEHIWASDWFVLVVLNVISLGTICCVRWQIGRFQTAHTHYKRREELRVGYSALKFDVMISDRGQRQMKMAQLRSVLRLCKMLCLKVLNAQYLPVVTQQLQWFVLCNVWCCLLPIKWQKKIDPNPYITLEKTSYFHSNKIIKSLFCGLTFFWQTTITPLWLKNYQLISSAPSEECKQHGEHESTCKIYFKNVLGEYSRPCCTSVCTQERTQISPWPSKLTYPSAILCGQKGLYGCFYVMIVIRDIGHKPG